jgi:hypothetical protein
MKNKTLLIVVLTLIWESSVRAEYESEPNDVEIQTSYFRCDGQAERLTLYDLPNPNKANPLTPNSFGMNGWLLRASDADWFYFDVPVGIQQSATVTFECPYASVSGSNITPGGIDNGKNIWTVEYWFKDANGSMWLQSRYIPYEIECSSASNPFTFGMNLSRPGRYYIRVLGQVLWDKTVTRTYTVRNEATGQLEPKTCNDKLRAYKANFSNYSVSVRY